MFCPVCENFMDITNINIDDDINKQAGGKKKKKQEDSSEQEQSDTVSSSNKYKKTSELTDEDYISILEGDTIDFVLSDFVMDDIRINKNFKKMDENQKILVLNRLYEIVDSKVKTKQKHLNIFKGNESYFMCNNCGHHEKITHRFLIFSTNKVSNTNSFSKSNIENYKYDHTFPRTKKYNCINEDCITHSEPIKKMAIFARIKDSLALQYICLECNSIWQI